MSNKPMVIVGGGLVGSLLATRLAKAGKIVEVYEKRPDPRNTSTEGRSINLALSHRGIRALTEAGVFEKLAPNLIPMHGRMMHDKDGNTSIQPYGKEGQFINSVSRADLNNILISEAEKHGAKFHFEHQCDSIDFEKTEGTFGQRHMKADAIFGTDGAFSAVRMEMKQSGTFEESVEFIEHSYKELRLEPKEGEFQLEPNFLHIWPRGKFMLIALPNPDKSFTCTLFLATEQMKSMDEAQVDIFFKTEFPDFHALMPDLVKQYFDNPVGSLVTVKCGPWAKGNVLLLGDAAHAIVPFYGQGMNAGFEDTRILMDQITDQVSFQNVFASFAKERKKDGDSIADLALKNFIEMRDWVGDDSFLKRKEIEKELNAKFSEEWIPQYSMVTFSDRPYSEAMRLGQIQDQVMSEANLENPDLDVLINRFRELTSTS